MYAVVDSGGKQYRVEQGRTLVIDRLEAEPGASVTFDRVLLIADEERVTVGNPTVSGASVRGTVLEHGRGPKVVVFRFRPKAHYRRRTGHRASLTRVRIEEIATGIAPAPRARKTPAPRAATAKTAARTAKAAAPRKAATAKKAAPAPGAGGEE